MARWYRPLSSCCAFGRSLLTFAAAVSVALAQAQSPHLLSAAEKARVDSLVKQMTLAQKLDYIGGTGFAVRAVPSLHIPALEMSDGPYGTRSNASLPSTTYAAGIGLAATWDRELAARVGGGIGRDARARGVHFMLGPGVNIYRSPRNGRNFEYFGEDPFLSSEMTVGYITGMQRQGVSATVKHFLGNNSEYLRHDSDSVIDERTLREIYLPAFEAAVKRAHVGSIMDSYNLVNGSHSTQNGYFNTEIVRKEWGFTGVMMSDWDATYDAVGAANGGLDLEMPVGKFMNRGSLEPAVKGGKVSEAVIDEKVRRILSTAASFGWLDREQRDLSIPLLDAENNATALDSARESIVLLKNAGQILPLDKARVKSILVVGPDAYPGVPVGGGSAGVVPFHTVGMLEGLSERLGHTVNVLYSPGLPTFAEMATETEFTTAVSGAAGLRVESFPNGDLSGAPKVGRVRMMNTGGFRWESLAGDPEIYAAMTAQGDRINSRRYTGYYNATADGRYIVALANGGEGNGDRVYVDGKLVIDDWKLVRAFEPHVTLPLSAGPHKVVVEAWQRGAFAGRLRLAIVAEDKVVLPRAKELAAKADVVVVSAGYASNDDAESESEGGDRTFALPLGQDELIREMASTNKSTIVALTSGGNVDSTTWLEQVPALLETWYPGQQGGQALTEVLLGDVNPSGHLPATFERRVEDNPTFANYYPEGDTRRVFYKEGIFVGYRGYEHNHVEPLFPFGYGLSYTSFRFSNEKAVVNSGDTNWNVTVSFDVTNTGTRKGAEVAQVYVSDDHAPVPRPMHELKGFERVELAPGETRHVSIPLDRRAFAFYDVAAKEWTVDAGRFRIHVGESVASLPLSADVEIGKQTGGGGL